MTFFRTKKKSLIVLGSGTKSGSSRMQFLSRISVPPRGYKETVEAVLGLSTGAAEYSNPWNLRSLAGKFCFAKCLVCPVASSEFLKKTDETWVCLLGV